MRIWKDSRGSEPGPRLKKLSMAEKKRLAQLKKTLEARREELLRSLAETQQTSRTVQQTYGIDEGDRANISHDKDILLRLSAHERKIVEGIDAALSRIRDGTYGECLNCGQEINAKRLEALPWSRYCITCQELIEEAR